MVVTESAFHNWHWEARKQQSLAINGFRKCQIEQIEYHMFNDHGFLIADTAFVSLAKPEI